MLVKQKWLAKWLLVLVTSGLCGGFCLFWLNTIWWQNTHLSVLCLQSFPFFALVATPLLGSLFLLLHGSLSVFFTRINPSGYMFRAAIIALILAGCYLPFAPLISIPYCLAGCLLLAHDNTFQFKRLVPPIAEDL